MAAEVQSGVSGDGGRWNMRRKIKGVNYLVAYIGTYVHGRGKPQAVAYMSCSSCGSLVKDPITHSEWHEQVERAIKRASVGIE